MNSTLEHILQKAVEHHQAGDIATAFRLYDEILAEEPDHLTALVNQSAIFMDLERPVDAAVLLGHAVDLAPDDIEALNNFGNALQKLGQTDGAIRNFKAALKLAPTNSAILGNLAQAQLRSGDYSDALDTLAKALKNAADSSALKFIDALALPVVPKDTAQMNTARERLTDHINRLTQENLALGDPLREVGMTNFAAAYHGLNDREIQEQLATAYLQACPELAFTAAHINQPQKSKRIKIGFVSVHLGSHTIGKLNRSLITGLDRNKFEVFVFCPGVDKRGQDDIIDEIAAAVDHIYFPAPLLTTTRSAIAEAALDILYYPDIGMEPLTYFLGFARLAPVQCVTWGHPVTTGLSNIDYFISSAHTEPADAVEHYTESLVQFENFTTDFVMPEISSNNKSRRDFGLNETANLYICPQSLFKFHPDFDDLLAGILSRDSAAEIILIEGQHPHWADLLRARFNQNIADASKQIKFIPRQSGADYLQLIALADVVLDTPHFCGGNTSYEAFAFGKPVVTLPGEFMRSRLTLGLYRQMGIEDAIAATSGDYINIAVKLGTDKNARAALGERIAKAHGLIFNANSAIRDHERFFLEAMALAGH
ncbi:MAG: tetratricopeptide repeat protein [Rhodospirillaceae bacterium]|jgi:protein O-GlcNAc transferase|nr:tetratricopeptide repeat protein [Rhodospirillaceae bacterium]